MIPAGSARPPWIPLVFVLFLAVPSIGCGAHFRSGARVPSGVPAFRCDADASSVEVENASNADDVRLWAARALNEMIAKKDRDAEPQPARFRLKVSVNANNSVAYWIFSPLTFSYGIFVGAPWWATVGHVTVEANLTMEVGGRRLKGIGRDDQTIKATGIPNAYYEAAVHNAVQNAMENAYETPVSPVAEAK